MLTVLHLSDLHWCPTNSHDLAIVVNALLDDVDRLREKENIKPDIIIFSGDLAMGGDQTEWFQGGYDSLLIPLSNRTGLSMDRIFVCPGNHDIAREQVRKIPSIEQSLRLGLLSTTEINRFMDTERISGSEKDLSLRRLDNFYDAHDSYHSGSISKSPFLRSFIVEIEGRSVGIACFNSAWRATGEADDVDYRKLVLGERAIDQALKDLSDCDFKIAVHHHPLDWLVPADSQTTDFLTRRSFNLSCCGHVHAGRPSMSRDATGTCITSQAGSVFDKREWFNGYQIVQIDVPSQSYTFTVREYINQHRRFAAANTVCDGGRVTLEGVVQGDPRRVDQIELFLRNAREQLRKTVLDHLSMVGEEGVVYTVSDLIVPPLTTRHRESIEKDDPNSLEPRSTPYKISELIELDDDLLILGDRQSGKTGIAHMLAYSLAYEATTKATIPVYVDLRDYKYNEYSIKRALINAYGSIPQGFDFDKAIEHGLFTIIADNLSPDEKAIEKLAEHIGKLGKSKTGTAESSKNRWIILGTPNSDGISPDRLYNERLSGCKKLYIRDLTRGGIRALSKRWYDDDKQAKAAFDMVTAQLIRDGLPRTPYMVSLLLWAFQQKSDLTKVSEALLLANVVDHLLGKADFRQAKRGVLNPVGMEITLQTLARFLKQKGGVATENEVTAFLIGFFDRKKLTFIGGDVLDKLIGCGLLTRDGDVVSFKHACFQDYFYAKLLNTDSKLLTQHLSGLEFLDVRRELELLAGLRQQNDDIIEAIAGILDTRVPDRLSSCTVDAFGEIARRELRVGTTLAQLGKIKRTRLTDEQVDEMMDEADRRATARGDRPVSESLDRAEGDVVQAAKEREAEGIKADRAVLEKPVRLSTHMAAIDTLARVIRNSDFTDYEIKGPATKRVLESWTKLFLLVMEEISEILKAVGKSSGDIPTEEEVNTIKYIMSKFMFNAVGAGIIGHLSSPAMSETLHSLVVEGSLSPGEYILVLFLLEDVNDKNWQKMWSDTISDKNQQGFVVDCFVQRLLVIAHSKALDDDQVKRVQTVVGEIEKRLSWSNRTKSDTLESMRKAVALRAAHQARV